MIRHCDGTDLNLSKPGLKGYLPCDCGNTFDDVDHSTIFPHGYIPEREVRVRWQEATLAEMRHEALKTLDLFSQGASPDENPYG